MTTCNACDAVSAFAALNAAGYCEECLGESEIALANDLNAGKITFAEYNAQFDAMHAEVAA